MNLAIAPSSVLPEKEFVSSATFGMLAVVTVLVLATAVAGSSVSTLMILALPVTLFALSLTNEQSRLEARQNARRNAVASATQSSEAETGAQAETYFPSWLGSKAYSAACAAEQD